MLDLARRVQIVRTLEIDRVYPERYANRVEVILKDGRRFETRVDYAKGSSERTLSLPEVAAKFRSLAAGELSPQQAEQVIEAMSRNYCRCGCYGRIKRAVLKAAERQA